MCVGKWMLESVLLALSNTHFSTHTLLLIEMGHTNIGECFKKMGECFKKCDRECDASISLTFRNILYNDSKTLAGQ